MEWTRIRQTLGGLIIGGGSMAIWLAFQRQMCTAAGTVGAIENQCAPNIIYLVPGILTVLFGIGLIQLRFLTLSSGGFAVCTLLYDLFVLIVQDETLSIGLLLLIVALLFAAIAFGSELIRARYGQHQNISFSARELRFR